MQEMENLHEYYFSTIFTSYFGWKNNIPHYMYIYINNNNNNG